MNLTLSASLMAATILLGCSGRDSAKDAADAASRAQRKQVVQDTIRAGPQTKSWQTPEGTVIELTIPKATSIDSFANVRQCIVWRDRETQTSSLFCDKDELDLSGDYRGDPPEIER